MVQALIGASAMKAGSENTEDGFFFKQSIVIRLSPYDLFILAAAFAAATFLIYSFGNVDGLLQQICEMP